MTDWADHMTTAFPEVRLKKFLEMRGADGGPWNRLCALPAFWVGLLYDSGALDAAWDLVKDFTPRGTQRPARRRAEARTQAAVPQRHAARHRGRGTEDLRATGLRARARKNWEGADESIFLTPLIEIVEANETPAERKLALYNGRWNHSVDPVFREFLY